MKFDTWLSPTECRIIFPDTKFQIWLNQSHYFDVHFLQSNFVSYSAYSLLSLITVTIINQIFTDISQTKHMSAEKMCMGYEKNTTFI